MNVENWSWKRKLLAGTLVAVALLVAGEITLRIWDYFYRHPYRYFDSESEIFRLVPNFREKINGSYLETNSFGFRAAEFSKDKPAEVFRIIMIGDSVTFGMSGEFCHYPGVVQHLFDRNGPGKVEVINVAVEGYNSRDALRLLHTELLDYRPDMVTLLIGWNDLVKRDPARPSVSEAESRLAYTVYDIYLVKFWRKVVYMYLRPALLDPEKSMPEKEKAGMSEYLPQIFHENLRKMAATVKSAGSELVLFTRPTILRPEMTDEDVSKLYFPHFTYNLEKFLLLHRRYNQTVRDVAQENEIPVVELQEAFNGKESRLFMDTAHPTCEGQRVLGQHVYDALSDLVRRESDRVVLHRR